MTIATLRTLLVPYTKHLESDFLMLNVCAKNRQHMNGPHSLQTARQLFQTLLEEPKIFAMAVLDIRTRDYLGHVFVDNVKEQAELVFLFDKQYWNQGIATEVLQRFLPTASHELGVQSLTANVDVDHHSSIRLLEKLGFQSCGRAVNEHGPYLMFTMTAR
ncbi:GNAT family N-acetyltransferase [Vibrio sp. ZSDZ65]|uniref:GNAT family N-acetyltransferase n=1 Tax=Vibrio qingdaonensis TaxID=2829491 RepID=A0A9X3CPM4_9VIBR|nr:GNAT family N-acetyltransferase [Vibrio qingdaonensis]MCW8347268.1 GNAT family N-acetyltransferase [Vibrio qingdaonensis]